VGARLAGFSSVVVGGGGGAGREGLVELDAGSRSVKRRADLATARWVSARLQTVDEQSSR
jgi:hypothetical protein